jgi:enamine deaminase RidA (YjgF/YER057c/UK114 family)
LQERHEELRRDAKTMSEIEARLEKLGMALPPLARSVGNYVPFKQAGPFFICVQGPLWGDDLRYQGRLGREFTVEQGHEAARLALLNIIAQLKLACGGDLSRARQCLRLGGFVNSTPEFNQHTLVMNAASDLLIAILGDRGRHARFVVGCSSLPYDLAIEIEGMFEIEPVR